MLTVCSVSRHIKSGKMSKPILIGKQIETLVKKKTGYEELCCSEHTKSSLSNGSWIKARIYTPIESQ